MAYKKSRASGVSIVSHLPMTFQREGEIPNCHDFVNNEQFWFGMRGNRKAEPHSHPGMNMLKPVNR